MINTIENKLGSWLIDGKQYSGMLSFSQQEGIFIRILSTEIRAGFSAPKNYPIITGIIESGEPITLINCQIFGSNTSMKNISEHSSTFIEKAIIRADYMIEGMQFNFTDEIKFRTILGRYSDLDEWVNSSGFAIEGIGNTDNDYDLIIKYKSPEPITFNVNPDFSVGIGFTINGPTHSMVQKEAKIQQKCFFRIDCINNPMQFLDLLAQLQWFSLLLQIGSHRKTYPIEIIGIIDTKDNPNLIRSRDVNIYYQPIEAIRDNRPLIPPFFLFTFNDLNEAIIKNWFDNYSTIQTIVNLRSTAFLHERQFIENKFLDILQALETLHNMKYDGRCIEETKFDELREKIISCIPDELVETIAPKVGNLNYLSLQDKLNELFQYKESIFSEAITNIKNFSKKTIKTRNLIVHPSSKPKPLSNKEIYHVCELLELLFDAYLLEMIGFQEENVNKIIQKEITKYLPWGIVFD